MISFTMQTTRIITSSISAAFFCLATGTSLLCSSCGAPDPTVQKELDQDILSHAKKKGPGNTTGPQYGQGNSNYGFGGY